MEGARGSMSAAGPFPCVLAMHVLVLYGRIE